MFVGAVLAPPGGAVGRHPERDARGRRVHAPRVRAVPAGAPSRSGAGRSSLRPAAARGRADPRRVTSSGSSHETDLAADRARTWSTTVRDDPPAVERRGVWIRTAHSSRPVTLSGRRPGRCRRSKHSRRPAMRPLAALYAIAASILVVGLVLQVFLAGLGVFDDPTFFLTHRDTGYTLELVALVVHRARRGRPRRSRPDRDRGADLRAVPAPVGVRRRARRARPPSPRSTRSTGSSSCCCRSCSRAGRGHSPARAALRPRTPRRRRHPPPELDA